MTVNMNIIADYRNSISKHMLLSYTDKQLIADINKLAINIKELSISVGLSENDITVLCSFPYLDIFLEQLDLLDHLEKHFNALKWKGRI